RLSSARRDMSWRGSMKGALRAVLHEPRNPRARRSFEWEAAKGLSMAARAYWKGQIRLALVSIPVEIYPATKSGAGISFRQIHEPSGKPIRYEKIVPGIGAIDTDDIIKGYETSKGNYVLLEDEEIEAVKLESKRTLELVQFVDAS